MMNGRPKPPCSGTQQAAPATSTPGSAFSRSVPSRISCATSAVFANRSPLSDMRIVST